MEYIDYKTPTWWNKMPVNVNDHAVHNPSHPVLYCIFVKTILSLSTTPSGNATNSAKHTNFEIHDAK